MMANDWKLAPPERKETPLRGSMFAFRGVYLFKEPESTSTQKSYIYIYDTVKSGKSSLNSAQTGAVKDRLWISQVLAWTCCYFGDFVVGHLGETCFWCCNFGYYLAEVFPANYHRVAT